MSAITPDTVEDVLQNLLDTGGPAFPSRMQELRAEFHGMTLRDYFAAQSLPAITTGGLGWVGQADADTLAERAYAIADAMLAVRGK